MKLLITLAAATALAAPVLAVAQDRAAPAPNVARAEGYAEAERLNAAVYAANIEAGVREAQARAAWQMQEKAREREYNLALARYNSEYQAWQRAQSAATPVQSASAPPGQAAR